MSEKSYAERIAALLGNDPEESPIENPPADGLSAEDGFRAIMVFFDEIFGEIAECLKQSAEQVMEMFMPFQELLSEACEKIAARDEERRKACTPYKPKYKEVIFDRRLKIHRCRNCC